MNASCLKISDYLLTIRTSVKLIDDFAEKFLDDYSDKFTTKLSKDSFKKVVSKYLNLCLTTRNTETGGLLIFSNEYGKGFKDILSDGIAHNIYAILKNEQKPIHDTEELKKIARYFVNQLHSFLAELTEKA